MKMIIEKYPAYVPLAKLPGYDEKDDKLEAFVREMAELQILLIQ